MGRKRLEKGAEILFHPHLQFSLFVEINNIESWKTNYPLALGLLIGFLAAMCLLYEVSPGFILVVARFP